MSEDVRAHLVQAACSVDDVDELKRVLARFEMSANTIVDDGQGSSVMHVACELGSVNIVRHLLSQGADMHLLNERGMTPLHSAAYGGFTRVIKEILKSGVTLSDVDREDSLGNSIVLAGMVGGYDEAAALLVCSHSAHPQRRLQVVGVNATCSSNRRGVCLPKAAAAAAKAGWWVFGDSTALSKMMFMACQRNSLEMVEVLWEIITTSPMISKSRMRQIQRSGVMSSARYASDECLRWMLHNGAPPGGPPPHLPIHMSCNYGHLTTSEILLDAGGDLEARTNKQSTALHVASQRGHAKVAEMLVKRGADLEARRNNEATPFYMACRNGRLSTAQLLLSLGADIEAPQRAGKRPLHIACEHRHADVVEFLLSNGADVDARSISLHQPVHYACAAGNEEALQLLLQHGVDLRSCGECQQMPILIACGHGHINVVRKLLESGVGVNEVAGYANERSEHGITPIMGALAQGRADIAHFLVEHGADLSALCGSTPAISFMKPDSDAFTEEDKEYFWKHYLLALSASAFKTMLLCASSGATIAALPIELLWEIRMWCGYLEKEPQEWDFTSMSRVGLMDLHAHRSK